MFAVQPTGIYSANIVNNSFQKLISSCGAKYYKYPTVSKMSEKIIFQREDKVVTEPDENRGELTYRLFMMNYDGSEKEEIVIPF